MADKPPARVPVKIGSLEEQEKVSLPGAGVGALGSAAIQAAIKAGNINIAETGQVEVMDLTDTSLEAQERQLLALRKLEADKRKRAIFVPTNPADVTRRLRELGQPVTLFGEHVADQRDRLREVLAEQELHKDEEHKVAGLLGHAPPGSVVAPAGLVPRGLAVAEQQHTTIMEGAAQGEAKKTELFYSVGCPELAEARRFISQFSFKRAPSRLSYLKRKREAYAKGQSNEEAMEYEMAALGKYEVLKRLVINQSQVGDDRPLSACRVSGDGNLVATGSWSSVVRVWDLHNNLKERACLRGHTERITGLAWQPSGGGGGGGPAAMDTSTDGHGLKLVTASVDSTARLWEADTGKELQVFRGHADRLAMIDFHPAGRHIATASYDHTWRLWDVETAKELLLQDGHSKEVHAVSFHPDGSLVVTGDHGGVGHVWDLRSGKSIWALQGHVKKILSADFHCNGYWIATGGDENSVKVWDVRKKRNFYTIPAHSNLISTVRFAAASGEFLLTSSFDGTTKLWNTRDWGLLKQLQGHEGKVMAADVTPDELHLITASYDRTFKLWADSREF